MILLNDCCTVGIEFESEMNDQMNVTQSAKSSSKLVKKHGLELVTNQETKNTIRYTPNP